MYIHIETNRVNEEMFELTQTLMDDDRCITERVFTEYAENRFAAALINIGLACRWIGDENLKNCAIAITSDRDGKDFRFGGEHNELFNILENGSRYNANRMKYSAFYPRYVLWLDRVRWLAHWHTIRFIQK